MMTMKTQNNKKKSPLPVDDGRKVSITYQDLASRRDALMQLALQMGHKRRNRMTGEEGGELAPLLTLMGEFVLAHSPMFRKWVAEGKPAPKP